MNLIFDTTNQALFLEKIDVDIYLEKAPILNDVYDILVEALCDSTTYKPGHIFKIAYALCGYIMKYKHPEECFPEMKQLLLSYDNFQLLELTLATTLVLLSLYRSPDHPTDMKIQRMSMLIKQNLSRASSNNADKLVHLANTYANSRIYADLDFKQHEDFIIEAEARVSAINQKTEEILKYTAIVHKHLRFLSGISPTTHQRFMRPEQYNNLINYMEHFIIYGEIPHEIDKINVMVNDKRFLTYTFHCIFHDLNNSIAKHTAKEWVSLMFAIFSNFDGTQQNTFERKFSDKPNNYDETITLIEKGLVLEEEKNAS